MKGIFVPLETLERWLAKMIADWNQIDNEWGPAKGGLEAFIKAGHAPEIEELRKMIAEAKNAD